MRQSDAPKELLVLSSFVLTPTSTSSVVLKVNLGGSLLLMSTPGMNVAPANLEPELSKAIDSALTTTWKSMSGTDSFLKLTRS